MIGIVIIGLTGFNIAMQFPKNEILIGVALAVSGGSGLACLPLLNELIVETTYPAGEATSTGISSWLAGPLTGVLVAMSSLISYSNPDEYPVSVCRQGEIQDLSWYLSILIGILAVYYPFFVYFYRKFTQFLYRIREHPNIEFLTLAARIFRIDRIIRCPYLRQEAALQRTVPQ